MKWLIFTCAFATIIICESKLFTGYQVFRLQNYNEADVEKLKSLENDTNYSFWSGISTSGDQPIDVMVAPREISKFRQNFITAELNINDVQELIDNERPKRKNMLKAANRTTMTWDDYYTYDEINNWLLSLTKEFPQVASLINVGKSYEGRDILGIYLSFNPENKNKGVLLEGGIHAREWIGVATVTYQLNELLRSTDPIVRDVAESHDWYIFPIYNPDGYVFTFTNNRMWRKTRKPYGACIGADPNRNWGFKWHEGDYNYINTCSEAYAGPRAFSEPETRQISEYLKTIGGNLVGYISHHAYSQLILLPYGDSKTHRDNYDELHAVGMKMADSIEKVNGTKYRVGNIVEVLYKATGNDVDWVKSTLKTRMTFIYELRDKGKYGFLLPANQIVASGQETLAGLVTMITEFKKIDSNL